MALTRRKFISVVGTAVATVALALAVAPSAFAASVSDPDVTISSYNEASAVVDGSNMQHVKVVVDYGDEVTLGSVDPMRGLTVKIAGYDIASDNYYRPATATAEGNTLVIDIDNVMDVDTATIPAFTAQYGGAIDIDGTPAGVKAGGTAVGALDVYSVVPTGVHVSMESGAGTSALSATVDHAANVRGMVHVALYDGSTGSLVPVNTSTTAGNLQVGTYTMHAHNFMSQTTADFAASIAGFALPEGYSIAADGSDLTVTGPEGSALYLYIFDDAMLHELGQSFDGIVSNEGVMTDFLPGA